MFYQQIFHVSFGTQYSLLIEDKSSLVV